MFFFNIYYYVLLTILHMLKVNVLAAKLCLVTLTHNNVRNLKVSTAQIVENTEQNV